MQSSMSAGPSATQTRSSGPNRWLVIGAVFTVLLLAAGGLAVAGWLGYRTEIEHQVYRTEVKSISIEVDTGDLTLAPGEPGVVTVERRLFWSFNKPVIDERWDGQALRVSGECGSWFRFGPNCGVDYTLQVPAGVSVQARTSTGDVVVRNIDGALQLTTSTGDVTVTGAAGELQLRTSTGDITASDITATSVDAVTSTGDLRLNLTAPPRTVSARTSTGDIRIVVPEGDAYRVQADASTGDVNVSVLRDDTSGRSITARASTGDVEVLYG